MPRITTRAIARGLMLEPLEARWMPSVNVGGFVYSDANSNGVFESGESPIAGVNVYLMPGGDAGIQTTVTDANGRYDFEHVPDGSYVISAEQPAGYHDGLESSNGVVIPGSNTHVDLIPITVAGGVAPADNNFGEYLMPDCHGSLSGRVFADKNMNGVFDNGDQPIKDVVLALLGENGYEITRTTTDADGFYSFEHLPGGAYVIREFQPAGFLDGPDQVGTVDGLLEGFNGANDEIIDICTPDCGIGVGYNFLEYCPPVSPPPPPPPPVVGSEGLTPGFWKNNATKHDASAWSGTGYYLYQTLGQVFNLAGTQFASLSNVTLVQALSLNGGGVNALMRHAVSALLNAAHSEIDYPLSQTQIVNQVNAAIASGDAKVIENLKNKLDSFNNLGADLNQHNNVSPIGKTTAKRK
jgi:SdrD B-like domain